MVSAASASGCACDRDVEEDTREDGLWSLPRLDVIQRCGARQQRRNQYTKPDAIPFNIGQLTDYQLIDRVTGGQAFQCRFMEYRVIATSSVDSASASSRSSVSLVMLATSIFTVFVESISGAVINGHNMMRWR